MTPGELHRRVFGFRFAAAIFAGLETGLFDALRHAPQCSEELSRRCGLDPRALRVWLDALTCYGVLERKPGHDAGAPVWQISPESAGCFDPDSPDHLGHLLQHDHWHWTRWGGLSDSIRTGEPTANWANDRHLSDPEVLRRFLPNYVLAMHESGRPAFAEIARRISKLSPKRVVDFGGGDGELLIALCRLLPDVRSVLVEHHFALEHARDRIEAVGLAERIEQLALNFEHGDLSSGALAAPYDVAILSRVLMGFPPEQARRVIQRIAAALPTGGHLVIHDFAQESRVGALLGLDMLLNTGGQVHDSEQIVSWMTEAGLKQIDVSPVLPYTRLWLGRKQGD